MWTAEFENDTTLGVMEDCYNNLKFKGKPFIYSDKIFPLYFNENIGHKFEAPQEPLPVSVDDEIRRKEEEELQRVLEMSMQDKGGRGQWSAYSVAAGSTGAGGSGSSSNVDQTVVAGTSKPSAATTSSSPGAQPKYQAGYVPARTPSPQPVTPHAQHFQSQPQPQPQSQPQPQQPSQPQSQPSTTSSAAPDSSSTSVAAMHAQGNVVTRVRALHTFEPTEPGELGFEKGDVIKVVDRGYKDWWRGQLKGRTGIFPVNYVVRPYEVVCIPHHPTLRYQEAMPEPTTAELAREAEQEAAVFAQAVTVEKLLNMLRSLDPAKDNLADNEEIQVIL